MSMNRFDRRTLLAATGLGSASLFLPSLFGKDRAFAQAQPPKRLVIFVTGHGTVYDFWRMRRNGLPEDRDFEFPLDDPDPASFSEILRPLHPHRSNLLVLDGLSLVSSI